MTLTFDPYSPKLNHLKPLLMLVKPFLSLLLLSHCQLMGKSFFFFFLALCTMWHSDLWFHSLVIKSAETTSSRQHLVTRVADNVLPPGFLEVPSGSGNISGTFPPVCTWPLPTPNMTPLLTSHRGQLCCGSFSDPSCHLHPGQVQVSSWPPSSDPPWNRCVTVPGGPCSLILIKLPNVGLQTPRGVESRVQLSQHPPEAQGKVSLHLFQPTLRPCFSTTADDLVQLMGRREGREPADVCCLLLEKQNIVHVLRLKATLLSMALHDGMFISSVQKSFYVRSSKHLVMFLRPRGVVLFQNIFSILISSRKEKSE